MKSGRKQSLMKRVNKQSSFTTADTATCYQEFHRSIGQHLSIFLFLVFSLGVGLAPVTVQAQTRAYVTNLSSNTVSVIATATNTVIATIPVGVFPVNVAITPNGTPSLRDQCP